MQVSDLARRRWPLALPAVASLVAIAGASASLSGPPDLSGDNPFHIGSSLEVANALAEGRSPFQAMPQAWGCPTLRFYQALPWLVVGATSAVTGVSTRTVFSWLVLFALALTPFAYFAMMRSLGAPEPAAGLVGLLSLSSNAAFSHSFGAYYETGILTQALGGAVFPLFVGSFARLLRGESGAVGAAARFAVAALCHATLMIYAAVVGVLALVTMPVRLRLAAPRLALFGALASLLVAFWVVPFLAFNATHRPISDAVVRPRHVAWFSALSPNELARVAASGRLLDGPRGLAGPDEEVIQLVNSSFGMPSRFPFLSIVALLGILVALSRIGKDPERFLLSGLAVGLLLLLGADEAPFWQAFLYRAQPIRAPYLVDFFSIALAGLGLHRVGAMLLERTKGSAAATGVRSALFAATALGAIGFAAIQIPLARGIAGPTPWSAIPPSEEALARVPSPGRPPGRWTIQTTRRAREGRMRDWMLSVGYPTHHHMSSLGPSTGYFLGRETLQRAEVQDDLAALVGLTWILTDRGAGRALAEQTGADGSPRWRQASRGRFMEVWRSTDPETVHAPPGPRVLVLANDAEWVWLVEAWMRRHAADALEPGTPIPVRVRPSDVHRLARPGWSDAVLVADFAQASVARGALARFARAGGTVIAGDRVPGVPTRVLGRDDPSWEAGVPAVTHPPAPHARTRKARLGGPYELAVSYEAPTLVLLPEHHYANWRVRADGRTLPTVAAGPDLAAAFVPPRATRLRFDWVARPFETWTLALSGIGWAGVCLWSGIGLFRRRRSRGARASTPPPPAQVPDAEAHDAEPPADRRDV